MNNIVTLDINTHPISIQIQNPTPYYPDAIIKRYVESRKTSIESEILLRTTNRMSLLVAVQDLFIRAVRNEERDHHIFILKWFAVIVPTLYVILTLPTLMTMKDRTTDSNRLGFNLALHTLIIELLTIFPYLFLDRMANRMGINLLYSI